MKIESLNKDVEVKKQPVGKFIQALKVLKNIPKNLASMGSLNESSILEYLPEIITSSYDEVVDIVTIVTTLSKEEVDSMDIVELIDLVSEIITVNEFTKIGESVKKKFGSLNLQAIKK